MHIIKYTMKKGFLWKGMVGLCALLWSGTMVAGVHTVKFDSNRTKSGAKIALRDLNPDLPRDWDGYNYVGVEIRVSTTQRFLLGFTTDHGYDELMLHSYVPGQWNRFVIPLVYLTQLPASSHDMASMYNKPRQTGWINIGGNYGPMTGVDSIGIRQYRPLRDAQVEIRDVRLYREDPGDAYLGTKPALDELGQSNLLEWEGKAHGLKQLKRLWKQEDDEKVSAEDLYGYSRYGGYREHRVQGTGYFGKQKVDGRWWLVDPDGCQFLSVGVCCIFTGGGGRFKDLDKRRNMLKQLPPEKYIAQDRSGGNRSAEFSPWNLERRFGPDNEQAAMDLTFKRMDKWGVNTIGNWSQTALEKAGRKAFTCTMRPAYVDGTLFGLGDPYEADFQERLEESLRNLMTQYRDNPWLIGYYVGNEPTWVGAEQRVCEALMGGKDRAMKTALKQYLQAYGDTPESRTAFVYDTFERYLAAVKRIQKKLDPNHMNLGYRFGNIYAVNERVARICAKYFDVMSFNCYAIQPDHKLMDKLLAWTDLPMIIGEFHFGAVDRGLGQSLLQVRNQAERGRAYRNYVETGFSHPGLVGVTYFTWNDEDVMGRFDGENYNCGLIDVTNVPYREQTEAMMETARRLYDVHAKLVAPYDQVPDFIVGWERGGDEW